MIITIHRGTNEIGGSCVEVVSARGTRIVIDIGMPLKEKSGSDFNMRDHKGSEIAKLIADGVLPDVKGLYDAGDAANRIDGVLISHAHADHYGLFNFVRSDAKMYMGRATKDIIDMSRIFCCVEGEIENPVFFEKKKPFETGDIKITPYLMDHSAFDAYAFLVEADGKKILYSGDFREHGRKKYTVANLIKSVTGGIDALILEGTTFGRPSKDSELNDETGVENKLCEIAQNSGMMAVYCSTQNIDRLVSIYRAAKRTNRTMVIDPYAANLLGRLAVHSKSLPHPCPEFKSLRVFFIRKTCSRIKQEDIPKMLYTYASYKVRYTDIASRPENYIMLVRPSMDSELKAMLKQNPDAFKDGNFIYSMWEGYLTKGRNPEFVKFFTDAGMDYHSVHVGGHATFETLKKVTGGIKPVVVIPIHTNHPNDYNNLGTTIKCLADKEAYTV